MLFDQCCGKQIKCMLRAIINLLSIMERGIYLGVCAQFHLGAIFGLQCNESRAHMPVYPSSPGDFDLTVYTWKFELNSQEFF